LLAPVLVFVGSWPALVPTDPDYWWHVRTGQLIVESGAIPHADVFSSTALGQPWITHEWLTELVFYVLQAHFGYVANVLLIGALGSLAALALYATCRRWGAGELLAVVLVLWAFGMSIGSFGVRPQALTRVLLTLTGFLLIVYRQDRDRRVLWLLPPIFGLWANLHGGFAVGLALLGLTVVGETIGAVRSGTLAAALPLALASAVCVAATLLTPNGLAGLLYPLSYAQPDFGGQHLVTEWQPPDLRQLSFAPFGLSLLLALALGISRRPLTLTDTLVALGFSLLGLQAVRNIQLYATIATPLIGARLASTVPRLTRSVSAWRRPDRFAALWSLVAMLCAAVWIGRFSQTPGWNLQLGKEPLAAAYPVGGAAYLRDHDVRGTLFNQFEWGGYLIYTSYPAHHVFIDGRPDMYGRRVLDDYVTVDGLLPGWRGVLDSHDVRLLLIERDGPLAAEVGLDPRWRELYVGPVERLFERAP
jgi:hypothetical protein